MIEKKQMHEVARYLVSGGVGGVIHWTLLYVFTEKIGLYYVVSASFSFAFALIVGFLLQKIVTFRNHNLDARIVRTQFFRFLVTALCNIAVNALLVYLFVEKFLLWYLHAQIVSSAILAVTSFYIYKFLVFGSTAQTTEAVNREP